MATIREELSATVASQTASTLKAWWVNLSVLDTSLPETPPGNDQLLAIAGDLHRPPHKASFTVKDDKGADKAYDISLPALDEKLNAFPEIKKKLPGGAEKLEDLFPSDDTLDKIAGAGTHVKQTLKPGFLDYIMAFFTAVMSWISGNGFDFKKALVEQMAPQAKTAISAELTQLANNDPAVDRFLKQQDANGHTTLEHIQDKAGAMAYETAGLKPPPSALPPAPELKDVAVLPLAVSKQELHQIIVDKITGADADGKTLADKLAAKLAGAAEIMTHDSSSLAGALLAKEKGKIDQAIGNFAQGIAPAIAETVDSVITDPALKEKAATLNEKDFVDRVTNQITEKLADTAKQAGVPETLLAKDSPLLAEIHKEVRAQIAPHYQELITVARAASAAPGENPKADVAAKVRKAADGLKKDMGGIVTGMKNDIYQSAKNLAAIGIINAEKDHSILIGDVEDKYNMRAADIVAQSLTDIVTDSKTPINTLTPEQLKGKIHDTVKDNLTRAAWHLNEDAKGNLDYGVLGGKLTDHIDDIATSVAAAGADKLKTVSSFSPELIAKAVAAAGDGKKQIAGGEQSSHDDKTPKIVGTGQPGPDIAQR